MAKPIYMGRAANRGQVVQRPVSLSPGLDVPPSQRGRRRTLGEVSVASDASFLTLAENKPLAVSMSAHTLSAVPSSADPSEDRSPEALEPSRSIHEAATVYRRKRLVCECSSVPQCPTVPNGDMSFRSSSCDHNSTGDCVQQPVDRMMMVTAREEAEKSLSSPRRRNLSRSLRKSVQKSLRKFSELI